MNTTDTIDTTITYEECINTCNKLLRGELSAVATYEMAIEKFAAEPACATLIRIRDEHLDSVVELQRNVRSMGGQPETDSGIWGGFVRAIQGAANLLGEASAVSSLLQGEMYGRDDYEVALAADSTMPECKEMIRTVLLPKILTHIEALDALK